VPGRVAARGAALCTTGRRWLARAPARGALLGLWKVVGAQGASYLRAQAKRTQDAHDVLGPTHAPAQGLGQQSASPAGDFSRRNRPTGCVEEDLQDGELLRQEPTLAQNGGAVRHGV